MRLKKNTWYFLQGYGGRTRDEVLNKNHVRTFCRRADYDVFLLVSKEVLEKLRYESEVSGFSTYASYLLPYPVFCVGLHTDNIQPIINKYDVDAIFQTIQEEIAIES